MDVAADFLLVSGTVEMTRAELSGMLSSGEMCRLSPRAYLKKVWSRAWSLLEVDGELSDGTEVWWLAMQCAVSVETEDSPPGEVEEGVRAASGSVCELADEALDEWLNLFARRAPE